jgi:hypothetical protein
MADFMTVLAASQGAHGGKTAASASGRMPAGFFSELVLAQFEAPAEPLLTLQAPPVSGDSFKLTADAGLSSDDKPALLQGKEAETSGDASLTGVLAPLFNPATASMDPALKAATPADRKSVV